MSRNNNSSKKQLSAIKPYCKVCHDAGKSEKEYTSHFVKSAPGPEGKVVCPTLLSQQCGYCFACGHTPKFCPIVASDKKAEDKARREAARYEAIEAEKAKPKPVAQKKQSSNIFDAFDSDSDSETKPKVSKKVSKKVVSEPEKPIIKPTTTLLTSSKVSKPALLLSKAEEFPALPTIQPKAVAAASPAKKTNSIKNSLAKLCPGLEIADKMPKVNTYKPPMAKLIRNKPQEAEAAMAPAIIEEDDEEEEWMVADYVAAAFVAREKASELDWAAVDSESDDDEEW